MKNYFFNLRYLLCIEIVHFIITDRTDIRKFYIIRIGIEYSLYFVRVNVKMKCIDDVHE